MLRNLIIPITTENISCECEDTIFQYGESDPQGRWAIGGEGGRGSLSKSDDRNSVQPFPGLHAPLQTSDLYTASADERC